MQMITNGKNGFFSNVRGGTVIEADNLESFMDISGANYGISRVPAPHPTKSGEFVPNQFFLSRNSDGVVVSPKTVTESCGVVTPLDLAESVRGLCDAGWIMPSDFFLQTKEGILGQTEILVFRVNEEFTPEIRDESDWNWYLLLTNPHGRGKVRGRIVSFRPWCSNQIASIMKDFDWSVSHRIPKGQDSVTRDKVISAIDQWETLQKRIAEMSKRLNLLMDIPLGEKGALDILNKTLKIPVNTPDDKVGGNRRNRREAIMAEFKNESRGTFGSSAYDLYMATTAFASHGSSLVKSKINPITRASSILSGGMEKLETEMANNLLVLAS